MAIAFVNAVSAGSSNNTDVTTGAVDTSGADFLIAACSSASGLTPSDSKGNTWTPLTAQIGRFDGRNQLWYVANATVGSGHTFSLGNGNTEGCSISVAAFSGVALSSPFDVENGGTATVTGTVTPSQDGSLIVSSNAIHTDSDHSQPPGFLTLAAFTNGSNGVHWDSTIAYEIQTTATARNADWADSGALAAVIAVFKPQGAGGGGSILRQMLQHHHYRRPRKDYWRQHDSGLYLRTAA